MVQEINVDNFTEEVINSDKLTVVDFFATWCGPCRKLGPILEEVETELGDRVNFKKIDTDDNIDAAKEYQVSGLPTLLVFKEWLDLCQKVLLLQILRNICSVSK